MPQYPWAERKIFEPFVLSLVDIFNLSLISRSLFNKIDKKAIKPYVLEYGYFLNSNDRQEFLSLTKFEQYYPKLIEHFANKGIIFPEIPEGEEDIGNIDEIILDGLFKKLKKAEQDDINNITLLELFTFIFKKELEIRYVVQKTVKLLSASHEV